MKSFFHFQLIFAILIVFTAMSSAQAESPDPLKERLVEVETSLRPFMTDGFSGFQNYDVAYQLVYLAYRIQSLQNTSRAFEGGQDPEQRDVDEKMIKYKYELLVDQFISWLKHEIELQKSIGVYDEIKVAALTSTFFTQLIKISITKRKNPDPFVKLALDSFKSRIQIEATEPSAVVHDSVTLTVAMLSSWFYVFDWGNNDIVNGVMLASSLSYIASNVLNRYYYKDKNKHVLNALKEVENTIDLIHGPVNCRELF